MIFWCDFLIYNDKNIFSRFVCIAFLPIFIYVKTLGNKFLKMKTLSDGKYFVIFENQINIYNSYFNSCSTIFSFNNSKITPTLNDIDNITISEYIKDDGKKFILSLIITYLFIYDYTNNNITYHSLVKLLSYNRDNEAHYYNFIPYKNESNNINFIISFIYNHRIYFLYYYIDSFQNIYCEKEKSFSDSSLTPENISPPELNCHILYLSSIYLECFYSLCYKKIIKDINFKISDDPIYDNSKKIAVYINLFPDFFYLKIRSTFSYNYKKPLVCTLNKDDNVLCFSKEEDFEEIEYLDFKDCRDLNTYFFNETNQFVLICKKNLEFKLKIIDYDSESNNFSSYTNKTFNMNNDCNSLNTFSLIYNNSINDYTLITDCNFTNCKTCLHSQSTDEIIETTLPKIINKDTTDIPTSIYVSDYMSILSNLSSTIIEVIEEEEIIKKYLDISKDEITNNLKEILKEIKVGKNYEIFGNDFNLKIKPTNSTVFDNKTHVEFDECEKILRNHYNISNSSIITFFQFEYDNDDTQSYIKQVEYQTYNNEKVILDLSLCKDVNIKIYHEIKEGVVLDESFISFFEDLGIDIFDINNSFFNDLCHPFSNNSNDIILQDRIKYIYQNYSLCEQDCNYNSIDIESMTIACDCMVKENLSTVISPLNFGQAKESSILDSNIGVIKCYNLVFSLKDKSKNIGFWIFLILVIANVIFLVIFFIKGMKSITEYIFNQMVIFGYSKKNNRKFFEVEKNEENNSMKISKKKNKKIFNPIKKVKIKNKGNENYKKGSKKNLSRKFTKRINSNINLSNSKNANSKQKIKISNKSVLNELKIKGNKKTKYKKNKNKKNRKISNITTENPKQKNAEKNQNNFGIIRINLNNIENYFPQDSFQTLHNYTFKEAIKYDRRSIFKIFYIYLLSKQIIFHTFFQKNPLELFSLRICLFIFMLSTDLALNSLLYLNDNISKKFKYVKGLFLFTFSNNLTIILLSTLLSFILISLISELGNSTNAIRNVFRTEEEKIQNKKDYKINDKRKKEIFLEVENILKVLKIKIFILIIIQNILILFFWYFVTAFCHVYKSTQTSWLLDSFLSFLSRLIIEFLFALLYAKLYIISVESNVYCLYRAILFIYDFS